MLQEEVSSGFVFHGLASSPLTIISGAQTGVDRAALDAALAAGIPCGGWVPAGRLDEDGVIPPHYPVKELKKGGYVQRTLQNLTDADGTLIIYYGELEGGTATTAVHCLKQGKPCRLIDAEETSTERAAALCAAFVRKHALASLNVAGPRASKQPEAYDYTLAVVSGMIAQLREAAA